MPAAGADRQPTVGEPPVRRLWPTVADGPLDDLYGDVELPTGPPGRPGVAIGMVSSLDGAASVGGTSRRLGGAADRLAYRRLRAAADVVLVGAGTARDEDYGPPLIRRRLRAVRAARGQAPRPVLAVVTRSADLDPGARLFTDPGHRTLVIAPRDAPRRRLARIAEVADVVTVGDGLVDLAATLDVLAERGARRVLCEGGPRLNAHLLAAGVVDELFLTVAPLLVGTTPHRIVDGPLGAGPLRCELVELALHADELVARYRVVA